MRCRACGRPIADENFCPQCGSRIVRDEDSQLGADPPSRLTRGSASDDLSDLESDLWQGTYSWKGLIREILAVSVATVLLFVAAAWSSEEVVQRYAIPAVIALWLGLLAWWIYQTMVVGYRLTNQRLIHYHGFLYRRTHRIEVIDIDDLSFEQGILERLVNVGRIRIDSSDVTNRQAFWLVGIDDPGSVCELIESARRRERLRHAMHIESI